MGYKIGSFNMYKFSYKETKDIDCIVKIIKNEQMDIVAMQEIFRPESMQSILNRLGRDWSGRHEIPPSKSSVAAEGYAFLWNTKRIDLPKVRLKDNSIRSYEPRIYNQYKIDRKAGQTDLIRNPFYGRFTPLGLPGGSYFEFRIINTHIMFSKSRNSNDIEDDENIKGDVPMRINEFNVLSKTIYSKEADKPYGIFIGDDVEPLNGSMPFYTILLGDYNLNLNRNWTKSPYLDEVIFISDGNKTKSIQTFQEGLTTLKRYSEDYKTENKGDFKYANNYDHFTFDTIRFDSVSAKIGKIDAVRKYYNSEFIEYRKNISDHLPIIMDFELIKN